MFVFIHFLYIFLENKSKSRWDIVQSMGEAKYALKHLFDIIAESRRMVDMHKGTIMIRFLGIELLYEVCSNCRSKY